MSFSLIQYQAVDNSHLPNHSYDITFSYDSFRKQLKTKLFTS